MIHLWEPRPAGEGGLYLVFGNVISQELNRSVHRMALAIRQREIPGITDCVPGYSTLYVEFDVGAWSAQELANYLRTISWNDGETWRTRQLLIPVCYEDEYAPDLQDVAEGHHMAPREVVEIHAGQEYQVYFIGFTPGFAFMGTVDERIATQRHATPRVIIPAGSVGIANRQTGVYSVQSPGGWRIVGRTPLLLYNSEGEEPILLRPGDLVRFVPIGKEEFRNIQNDPKEWRLLAK